MKKKFGSIFFLICVSFLLIGCSNKNFSIKTEAQILSVNENILAGKLIGNFLSSASGNVSNDVNKVGVKIEVFDKIFLKDLKMSHALLAYYRNANKVPVTLNFTNINFEYICEIKILEESVYSFDADYQLCRYLYKKQKGKK